MKKILIIEDDIAIAELERDYLEVGEFAAEMESDGAIGLQKALTGDYDLILLDVMLPNMDGFQICRSLRKEKDIPIIMVSAKREDIDKIRGLGLGADDYIIKPFSPSELVARVKAHLARFERLTGVGIKNQQTSRIIYAGDLEIQLDNHRVFIDKTEIILANKEFELLTFLAENAGMVFSKERLLERVWGFDAVIDTATVTVHINRIREKIEPNPIKPQYIETVWGAGYRFKIYK